jgi:hypothetical protein
MQVIALVLIVSGVLGMACQHAFFNRGEQDLTKVGALEIIAEQKKSIPLPPVLGFLAIAGSSVLLIGDPRSDV